MRESSLHYSDDRSDEEREAASGVSPEDAIKAREYLLRYYRERIENPDYRFDDSL